MRRKRPEEKFAENAAMSELERVLGHTFSRPELLTLAVTHRSFVYDSGTATAEDLADPAKDNEQLEFMGDAALGLLAAEGLCRLFPGSREGELTRMRASIVSRKYLGEVGTRLSLGRWLRLGQTTEKNDGRRSAALFANAMEALIAALYLDGGLEVARRFVEREILSPALPGLERSLAGEDSFGGALGDHKSALQEMLQADGLGRPEYRLVGESGPDHKRLFRVEVRIEGASDRLAGIVAEAEGSSKKQAQQEAARLAVARLAEALDSSPADAQTPGATQSEPETQIEASEHG